MTSISPCLWFDDNLEEAAEFYTKIFPNSSVGHIARYNEAGPGEPGTAMAGDFDLDGLKFRGINGGPELAGFTESISFAVSCKDQAEVDHYWDALTDGGEESQCGWLKDRFGLSWQVVPGGMEELFADPDRTRAERAMRAMLGMKKIDVAAMIAAADQTP